MAMKGHSAYGYAILSAELHGPTAADHATGETLRSERAIGHPERQRIFVIYFRVVLDGRFPLIEGRMGDPRLQPVQRRVAQTAEYRRPRGVLRIPNPGIPVADSEGRSVIRSLFRLGKLPANNLPELFCPPLEAAFDS
jgi:hypothetical protein